MMGFFSRWLDPFRGSGDHAITVPPMDGALQPNEVIEQAPLVWRGSAPDALLLRGDDVLVSSKNRLIAFPPRPQAGEHVVAEFDAEIACAAMSAGGTLAIGLADGRVVFRVSDAGGAFGPAPLAELRTLGGAALACPTALAWMGEESLVVCNGSQRNGPLDWKRDLTQRGSSGSVWLVDLKGGGGRPLAQHLAFPNGVMVGPDGDVTVTESWKSRLLRIAPDGRVTRILSDLPAYPAGLANRSGGGAWLALFAPRSQLFEFILREREFREQMMRDVDPEFWMAPSLRPPSSFLEPLQGGALKQLGIMKPWAPSRSYGLVLALDQDFRPEASAHSRANGSRHGIRNIVERDGSLLIASKGGDAIVSVPLNGFGGFA
jgi:sugar lactone lactonase YvrE